MARRRRFRRARERRVGGLAWLILLGSVVLAGSWGIGLAGFIDGLPRSASAHPRAADAIVVLTGGSKRLDEGVALLQARAIRDNMRAEWGIAESGSAGSSKHPLGVASGRSIAAVAGPLCDFTREAATDSDDRIANMEVFTRNALDLLEDALSTP